MVTLSSLLLLCHGSWQSSLVSTRDNFHWSSPNPRRNAACTSSLLIWRPLARSADANFKYKPTFARWFTYVVVSMVSCKICSDYGGFIYVSGAPQSRRWRDVSPRSKKTLGNMIFNDTIMTTLREMVAKKIALVSFGSRRLVHSFVFSLNGNKIVLYA